MAKICSVCGLEKFLIDFSIDRSKPDNKRDWCRKCGRKRRRKESAVQAEGMPECKPCSKCKEVKRFTEFHRSKKEKTGLSNRCRVCLAAGNAARYLANKVDINKKNRASYYKKLYGIDMATYEAMHVAQDGRCAICSVAYPLLRLDHDHKTGKVRGLLCHNCNVGIGHFKDDEALLHQAIAYLKSQA